MSKKIFKNLERRQHISLLANQLQANQRVVDALECFYKIMNYKDEEFPPHFYYIFALLDEHRKQNSLETYNLIKKEIEEYGHLYSSIDLKYLYDLLNDYEGKCPQMLSKENIEEINKKAELIIKNIKRFA